MNYRLILLLSFLSVFSFAQKPGDIEIGVGGGLNISTFSANNYSFANQVSYNFNADAEFRISPQWGVKTGLFYDRKGAENFAVRVDGVRGGDVLLDFTMEYYTVPLTATYHFGEDLKWYIDFGLYAGFLNTVTEDNTDDDLTEGFEDTDVGFQFAFGIEFIVAKNGKIFIEFDGQYGFSDLFTEQIFIPTENFRNSRSAINVGYRFLLF